MFSIFRDDNWSRVKSGFIRTSDFMRMDKREDEMLINFMLHRAPEPVANRGMLKHRMKEMPEPLVNIDDPEDKLYPEYLVLREQVIKEENTEVLKNLALNSSDWDIAAFAFCRLTGFSWPPDDCDAYSYRTYSCGLKADMPEENIKSFCQEIIEQNGYFAKEAAEILQSYK